MIPCMRSFPYQRPPLWSVCIPKVMTVHYSWSKTTPLFVQLKLLGTWISRETLLSDIYFQSNLRFFKPFEVSLLVFVPIVVVFAVLLSIPVHHIPKPEIENTTKKQNVWLKAKTQRVSRTNKHRTENLDQCQQLRIYPSPNPKKSTDNKFGLILR